MSEVVGEGSLGFSDIIFSVSYFGSVVRNEVEYGLGVVEFGDWGENIMCVVGEEDDVVG